MYNQKYTATGFEMHNCDNCSNISHVKHSGPSTRNSFAEKIENVSSYFFIKKTPMEFLLIPISKEKWLTSVQSLPHLSTSVAWRVKMFKHFFFYKYFCLVLGLLKSRVSKKNPSRALGENSILSIFTIRLVSKITAINTRNRCSM